MIFEGIEELEKNIEGIIQINGEKVVISDERKVRNDLIEDLVYSAVLSRDGQVRHTARVYIRKIADSLDIFPASIHPLYMAFSRGEVDGFSVPAMNVRALSYDFARSVFKTAIKTHSGAFIFEIARSEMEYTFQDQDEIAICVLAAAVKEGWSGPVFLQGDHYQFHKDEYLKDPNVEITSIQNLIKDAIAAGFYNIDIDASTLVDLDKEDLDEQQKENIGMTALMTKFIRGLQPRGMTIAIGGEIGHIGGINSTVEDFEAFMKGYKKEIDIEELNGIIKVSVQTGTHHGGVPKSDGSMEDVVLDFSVLKNIGHIAREKYQLGGPVQHGASTLPDDLFDEFPKKGTVEVHLATGFQNIIFDNLPEDLKVKMYDWVRSEKAHERKRNWTDEQFIYKLRKKSFGPFKKDLWNLSIEDKEPIIQAIDKKVEFLFDSLNIEGTRHTVKKYIG